MNAFRRARVWLIPAFLAAASLAAAAPRLTVAGQTWTVSNQHYTAAFDAAAGGLLSALTWNELPAEPVVTGQRVYTDWGIYEERTPVSSAFEHEPRMSHEEHGDALLITAEGPLTRDDRGPWDARRIRYAVSYLLNDSPTVAVRCSITPEFDADVEPAFMAHVMNATKHTEWFAHTQDGLVCEDALDHSDRTWQSALEPMDRARPFFGTVDRGSGLFVLLVPRDERTLDACENIFFHDSGQGATAPFFAWFAGYRPQRLAAGEERVVEYSLTLGRAGLSGARNAAKRSALPGAAAWGTFGAPSGRA